MAFDEKNPASAAPHRVVLDQRRRLTISGVEEVESFDESSVVMRTNQGALLIHGSSLHIEKLSLDGGEVLVQGEVDALTYEEELSQGGFFSRLFRG
ncbi:MAG: sporulation protein YabP [Ruminiclostridium sp.]|jgi:sporulation protein YabP|nr:sporulation protein YabP [Ruminiclostridium sp.]